MKCEACDREIALAKRCPYCGKVQKSDGNERKKTHFEGVGGFDEKEHGPRGEFKGRIEDDRTGTTRGTRAERPLTFFSVLRYLLDPTVSSRRKWLLYAAIFYILSPIDLLPGYVFGPLGWLDDLGVLFIASNWLRREINRTNRV